MAVQRCYLRRRLRCATVVGVFNLAVLTPAVVIAGDYTLTLAADQACADLPTAFRSRSYAATLTPRVSPYTPAGTQFDVSTSGASFAFENIYRISIGVAGITSVPDSMATTIRFLSSGWAQTGYFVQRVGSWSFRGHTTRINHRDVVRGLDQYSAPLAAARCESKNHRLTLTRR